MPVTIASPLLFAPATVNAAAAHPGTRSLHEYVSATHAKASQLIMQHSDALSALKQRESDGAQWSDSPADHSGRISLSTFADQIAEHSDALATHLPRLEKALGITGLSQAVTLGTVPAAPVSKPKTVDQVVSAGATDPGRGLGR